MMSVTPAPTNSPYLGDTVVSSPFGVTATDGIQSVAVGTDSIILSTQSTPRITILSNGYVGIGTTPKRQLHVSPGRLILQGPTSSISLYDGNTNITCQSAKQAISLTNGLFVSGMIDGSVGTPNVPILNWISSGKVGIGTFPNESSSVLTISGTVKSYYNNYSGNLSVGNLILSLLPFMMTVPNYYFSTATFNTIQGTTLLNGNINLTQTNLSVQALTSSASTQSANLTVSSLSTGVLIESTNVSLSSMPTPTKLSTSLLTSGTMSTGTITVKGSSSLYSLSSSSWNVFGTTSFYTVSSSSVRTDYLVSGYLTSGTLTANSTASLSSVSVGGNTSTGMLTTSQNATCGSVTTTYGTTTNTITSTSSGNITGGINVNGSSTMGGMVVNGVVKIPSLSVYTASVGSALVPGALLCPSLNSTTTILTTVTDSGSMTSGTLSVSSSLTISSLTFGNVKYKGVLGIGTNSTFYNMSTSGNTVVAGSMTVSGMTQASVPVTVGTNAISRYSISQSQTASLSLDNGLFSTAGLFTGSSYNSCSALSWNSAVGYVDTTGTLTIRNNDGNGNITPWVALTNGSFTIGPGSNGNSGLLQVNVGGLGGAALSAMGYSGYPWDSGSVVFSNNTSGFGFGYHQTSSSGMIACGDPSTGPKDMYLSGKSIQFYGCPNTNSNSCLSANSSGIGIGTNSAIGLLDVYGNVIVHSQPAVSFKGLTSGGLGSYYINGYMKETSPSPTLSTTPVPTSYALYDDMGGMKLVDTTASSIPKTDIVWYSKISDMVMESMRLASGQGGVSELQMPRFTAGSGQLRMTTSGTSSYWLNDNTNTYLLLSNSSSYRPFLISNSSGMMTSSNGQTFSGGLVLYGGLTASSCVWNGTASSSVPSTLGAVTTNGLTVDNAQMDMNLSCTGNGTMSSNVKMNPGKTVISTYYTMNFSGSPLLSNTSGVSYATNTTISSATYAYCNLSWPSRTSNGTSSVLSSLLGTTTSLYQVSYNGIYTINYTLAGATTGTVIAFIGKNTLANGTELTGNPLASSRTPQKQLSLSWTGILSTTDKITIGFYVESGTFLPNSRSSLTFTLLQRSA